MPIVYVFVLMLLTDTGSDITPEGYYIEPMVYESGNRYKISEQLADRFLERNSAQVLQNVEQRDLKNPRSNFFIGK